MSTVFIIFAAVIFLAYANGSNDNFKGVATLFGSGTTDYKTALRWATITTFSGSVCSIFFAQTLLKNFSGKALVPDSIAGAPEFLTAVAIGAGLTVFLATLTGFPISTTHSLTGALVGTGLIAAKSQVNLAILGNKFFLPLLVSPFIALLLGSVFYFFFRAVRVYTGITKEWCLCTGQSNKPAAATISSGAVIESACLDSLPKFIAANTESNCSLQYTGQMMGISVQSILDFFHFLSAGVVSFARGLNDTPKIIALLITIQALNIKTSMLTVGIIMALGGIINSRKVAQTVSKNITPLNSGQGFTANLVTGILVIFASRLGMPVSTTHVSVGSIFGIGLITKKGNIKVISEILLSWLLTLPIAAILAAFVYRIIN